MLFNTDYDFRLSQSLACDENFKRFQSVLIEHRKSIYKFLPTIQDDVSLRILQGKLQMIDMILDETMSERRDTTAVN